MRAKTSKTDSFKAVDDGGHEHIINEWTISQDVSGHSDDSARWEPVALAFRLDNGNRATLLDDGTIYVHRTGMRLRRM
jgi:hypothetical protein